MDSLEMYGKGLRRGNAQGFRIGVVIGAMVGTMVMTFVMTIILTHPRPKTTLYDSAKWYPLKQVGPIVEVAVKNH